MRTWSRTSSRTEVRTFDRTESGGLPPVVGDPYYNYTTLLLPGNGTNGAQNNTFLDSSTNAFSITRNGNTTQGTFSPFSQTGWGNYFDGTGDYLAVSYLATNFGTADFTVETWVYPTARSASPTVLLDTRASGTSNPFVFGLTATNGYLYYYNGSVENASTTTVPLNTWSHIAISRSGTTARLFVNGVQSLSVTDSSNLTGTSTGTVRIGQDAAGGSSLTGYFSNFRVVKGTAVYTSNFTPSTTPLTAISGTSLLTCQSNRFIDNSSNAFAITRNGDVSVQAFSPFNPTAAWSASTNGGSAYYDGSGDYLSTTTNIAAIGTGDFTLEVWCYPTATTSYRYFLAIGPDTNFATGLSTGGYAPYLYSSGFIITSSISTVPNAWNHVQYVRSSGTLTVYVNGVSGGSVSWTGSIAAGRGYIGANDSNLYYFFGYHSSLRFSNTARAVSVPTAPYTSDANTQLLLNFTNAGIYDATSKNDLETVGNAQISTTQSKFGGSSMYFDGTGDWLQVPNGQNYVFGTGDFTIEFWYYGNDTAGGFGQLSGGTSGYWQLLLFSSSMYWQSVRDTTNLFNVSASSILNNAWHHVAVTRYSGTTRLFFDGIQVASAADTTNYNGAAGNFILGRDTNGADIAGYINDYRITKGIARYTANFTPPTTAFLTL